MPPAAADAETPVQTSPETAPTTTEKPRDRNAEVDFRGQKRSTATHTSGTDPEARLYKKSPGTGASLCFIGHTLMDEAGSAIGPRNPPQGNGPIVQTEMTQADGHAERRAALAMIHRHSPGSTRRLTGGADKGYDCAGCDCAGYDCAGCDCAGYDCAGYDCAGYDCAGFVNDLRQACVTPHVAQKVRHSAVDGRTTRHSGYAISQKRRKKTCEPLGWAKTVGPMAQTTLRGVKRMGAQFTVAMAACNLARLPRLLAA